MDKVTYEFTDDMFPAAETIQVALSKAGFELDNNYTGTSHNPALIYIFNTLISEGHVSVLETVAVDISKKDANSLSSILSTRYGFSSKKKNMFDRISRGSNMFIDNFNSINKNNIDDMNYIAAYILGMNGFDDTHSEVGAKSVFDMIQYHWQNEYKVISLAPFSFIENFINIKNVLTTNGLYEEYSFNASKHNGAKTLGTQYLKDTVNVAFMFSYDVVYKLADRGLNAETIMSYVNSGIGASKDILEWSENMPSEWAEAILSGVR